MPATPAHGSSLLEPAPLPQNLAELLPSAEPLSLLDERGERRSVSGLECALDADGLRHLYATMVLARRIDAQASNLGRQGRLSAFPAARGQEATEVGAVLALGADDWLFPTYRETMAVVARGVDPIQVLRANQGTASYDYDFSAERVATMAIPLATQALHAAGLALAAKLRRDPIVALTFLGDGASSEGDAHEAMNFAATFGVPCVFLLVNNQYAISVPVTRQTHAPTFAHRAIGYGMPGVRVDGNDALAVHAATSCAVRRARRGGGPTLIEAVTFRMEPHTTSDDPTRYRADAEVDAWRERDPLARLEQHLRSVGILDDAAWAAAADAAEAAAARVRDWAAMPPVTDPQTMFDHAYADPPTSLRTQRAQLGDELRLMEATA
jgi:2-oxoisovalerate dehydrogenase E1 component subunit alpha